MDIIVLVKVRDRWDCQGQRYGLVVCKLSRAANGRLFWESCGCTAAYFHRSFTKAYNEINTIFTNLKTPILNRTVDRKREQDVIYFEEKDLKRLVPFDEFQLKGKKQ